MSLNTTATKISYTGNNATTVFAFPYYFLDQTHLIVTLTVAGVTTTQILGTNYTVSGVSAPGGGSVTMTVAPATGSTLLISRVVPLIQLATFLANAALPSKSLEQGLDLLTMIVQQIVSNLLTNSPSSGAGDPSGAPTGNTVTWLNTTNDQVWYWDGSKWILILG